MISTRRSYTDVIQSGLFDNLFNTLTDADEAADTQQPGGFGGRRRRFEVQDATPSFYFYDVNSKLTWTPTSRDVVAMSLYSGADNLDQSSAGQAIQFGGNAFNTTSRQEITDWGNRGLSRRWFRQWGARFSSDAQVAASEYFSDGTREITSDQFAAGFLEENRVQDLSLRLDNTWRAGRSSTLDFGALLTQSDVRYGFEQLQGDSVRGELGPRRRGAPDERVRPARLDRSRRAEAHHRSPRHPFRPDGAELLRTTCLTGTPHGLEFQGQGCLGPL